MLDKMKEFEQEKEQEEKSRVYTRRELGSEERRWGGMNEISYCNQWQLKERGWRIKSRQGNDMISKDGTSKDACLVVEYHNSEVVPGPNQRPLEIPHEVYIQTVALERLQAIINTQSYPGMAPPAASAAPGQGGRRCYARARASESAFISAVGMRSNRVERDERNRRRVREGQEGVHAEDERAGANRGRGRRGRERRSMQGMRVPVRAGVEVCAGVGASSRSGIPWAVSGVHGVGGEKGRDTSPVRTRGAKHRRAGRVSAWRAGSEGGSEPKARNVVICAHGQGARGRGWPWMRFGATACAGNSGSSAKSSKRRRKGSRPLRGGPGQCARAVSQRTAGLADDHGWVRDAMEGGYSWEDMPLRDVGVYRARRVDGRVRDAMEGWYSWEDMPLRDVGVYRARRVDGRDQNQIATDGQVANVIRICVLVFHSGGSAAASECKF
ncbi:hypothetical protein B0H13DRAFT_1858532 [Mycena leptocephala]|nr:hypothetical protein B0H13DRAFT_1858532 [Mycena leptocephala]